MNVSTPTAHLEMLLQNPHTFMNIIGLNVSRALKSNNIDKANIIVIHDDLEQKLGKFRMV